jgi:hypothetical protein
MLLLISVAGFVFLLLVVNHFVTKLLSLDRRSVVHTKKILFVAHVMLKNIPLKVPTVFTLEI